MPLTYSSLFWFNQTLYTQYEGEILYLFTLLKIYDDLKAVTPFCKSPFMIYFRTAIAYTPTHSTAHYFHGSANCHSSILFAQLLLAHKELEMISIGSLASISTQMPSCS